MIAPDGLQALEDDRGPVGHEAAHGQGSVGALDAGQPLRVLGRDRQAGQRSASTVSQQRVGVPRGGPRPLVQAHRERVDERLHGVRPGEDRLECLDRRDLAPSQALDEIDAPTCGAARPRPSRTALRAPRRTRPARRCGSCAESAGAAGQVAPRSAGVYRLGRSRGLGRSCGSAPLERPQPTVAAWR